MSEAEFTALASNLIWLARPSASSHSHRPQFGLVCALSLSIHQSPLTSLITYCSLADSFYDDAVTSCETSLGRWQCCRCQVSSSRTINARSSNLLLTRPRTAVPQVAGYATLREIEGTHDDCGLHEPCANVEQAASSRSRTLRKSQKP
jgi:hypothetical protein